MIAYALKTAEATFSWKQKINPVWWVGVYDNPTPPANYAPGERLRNLKWHFRNFLHNFRRYVVGVSDRDRIVVGPMALVAGAYPTDGGAVWGWTIAQGFPLALPYFGARVKFETIAYDFAIGWSSFGMLMTKARIVRKGSYDWSS